ncbi:hypothetical protein ACWGS9_32565 [Bradyrhizobium sp. Arg314]
MESAVRHIEADIGDHQHLDRLQPDRLRPDGGDQRLRNETLNQKHRRADDEKQAELELTAVPRAAAGSSGMKMVR